MASYVLSELERSDMPQFNPIVFDPQLLRRFGGNGPRYTSYPTADRFVEAFDSNVMRQWLGKRAVGGMSRPLSLYVHIPFCNTICFYCGCNKIITKNQSRAAKYLRYLAKEIALQAEYVGGSRNVSQLHLGGGTPTFLEPDELRALMAALRAHFNFLPGGEYSIEIDPRKVSYEKVATLAELGFNRMSLGVQDFDPQVQVAVNRIQSIDETRAVIEAARENDVRSVSIDLIYGLPKQSEASFDRTLDQVLMLAPDRVSLYSYAHLPEMFKPQRRILSEDLPTPEEKLQILQLAIRRLTAAGYVYIGMDHFARPDDDLAVAQRQGRLHRNFQGYSTQAECDLLAFGVSGIATFGPIYAQNHKRIEDYYDALDQGRLPVMRGIELSADDLLRRSIIQSLMCHFELSIESIEIAHLINFSDYFAEEMAELRELEEAGLVTLDDDWITVKPEGRLLVRAVAMVFDRYLRADRERVRYSRVI